MSAHQIGLGAADGMAVSRIAGAGMETRRHCDNAGRTVPEIGEHRGAADLLGPRGIAIGVAAALGKIERQRGIGGTHEALVARGYVQVEKEEGNPGGPMSKTDRLHVARWPAQGTVTTYRFPEQHLARFGGRGEKAFFRRLAPCLDP